jgi:hypothetical protein
MTGFRELLSKHVGSAFARQLAFADVLGERGWSLSVTEGIAKFGDDMSHPVQLLGTEAHGNNTWLWAWANEQSDLPPTVLVACNKMRELGTTLEIDELKERSFDLGRADGHSLALVSSGIIGNCCYYRGPYDGGALFFLVERIPSAILKPVEAERAVTVITEVISQFDVDHGTMSQEFLRFHGFTVQSTTDRIQAERGGDSIELSLDAQGRISNIGAKIRPRPAAAKQNRWWEFWK